MSQKGSDPFADTGVSFRRRGITTGVPRRRRIELPGSVLHVGSRGVDQRTIFLDLADRRRFLVLLADVVTRFRWRCMSYCLMTNHYHLVLELREPNLSDGMQSFNGRYARAFNDRHARTGHLFEHRYWSEIVTRESHILSLARYVALNPVRARLCQSAGDWPWSAHGALVGERPPGFVDVEAMLCHFDEDPQRARSLYASYVAGEDPDAAALATAVADPDRDRAIARAHLELGYPIPAIAEAMRCHPRTVRRRLAAMSPKGSDPFVPRCP